MGRTGRDGVPNPAPVGMGFRTLGVPVRVRSSHPRMERRERDRKPDYLLFPLVAPTSSACRALTAELGRARHGPAHGKHALQRG